MYSSLTTQNTKKSLAQPTEPADLELPNSQYAYDDEDINNRVNAEIFQQRNESVYSYDTVSKTFSASITNPNQQVTNFLISLKKQWQIIIVPAVSNALSDIEAVLQPIIKQIGVYVEWAKIQPQANDLIGIRLLFPYKLDAWHWNLGEVSMFLNRNKAVISCVGISHDPFGSGNIESTLKECLKKLLRTITHENNIDLDKTSQFQLARQKRGVYCGIVTARDLLRRIDDLPLDDVEYCTTYNYEMDVRKEDLDFFRKHLGSEEFKHFFLKQKRNNFDHYVSLSQLQLRRDQISEVDRLAVNQLILEVNALKLSANLLQELISFFRNIKGLEFGNYFIELKNNLIHFKERLQAEQLGSYQSFLKNLFGVALQDRNETLIKPEIVNAFYNYMIHQVVLMQSNLPATSVSNSTIPHAKPALSSITNPLTVQDIITNSTTKPKLFLMDHLLAAGFSGTVYQLLVFINSFLTKIVKDPNANFYAMVEKKGHGNLDDVSFVITDPKDNPLEVEAQQVKYFKEPININDFFNHVTANSRVDAEESEEQPDDELATESKANKNKKMHIGKFFLGWLKWKKEFPSLPENQFRCTLFSNTSIDELLKSCLESGKNTFKRSFIDHQDIVKVSLRLKNKATPPYALPFNFFKDKSGPTSKKIWQLLQKANYIDEEGHFTELLEFDRPNFTLELGRLPRGVTANAVLVKLKEINEALDKQKFDVFQLLYEQAFTYLNSNSSSADFLEADQNKLKTEIGKLQLFRSFLTSLQLQINQPNLTDLEVKILENLSVILGQQSDQIFLCLYYAIHEWFVKVYPDQQVPSITKKMMISFLQTAKAKSQDLFLLQGQTIACLSRISYQSRGQYVPRAELPLILETIKKPGFILISGRKGLGKSGLIKQALEQQHSAQYLMIPATDINDNQTLREMLKSVVNLIGTIQIIVIDSAELISPLSKETEELLKFLARLKKTIVFTVTPGYYDKPQIETLFKEPCEILNIESLSQEAVRNTYPQLQSFLKRKPIATLAKIPFHLASLIRLAESTKLQNFGSIPGADSSELESELIKLDIQGIVLGNSAERRLAWHQLAFRMASTPKGLAEGIEYSKVSVGLALLKQDGMVYCKGNRYFFSHDLYFEHGLMSYWTQKWEILYTEAKTKQFWTDLPNSLRIFVTLNALEDWLILHQAKLQDDILLHISIISKMEYLNSIVAASILTQTKELIQRLLEETKDKLSGVIYKIGEHYNTTLILFSIVENKPESLKLLLNNGLSSHHPKAGSLIINNSTHTAYYEQEAEQAENSSNSNSDENSECSEDHYNFNDNSDTSDKDDDQDTSSNYLNGSSPDQDFSGNPNKYWSAGFDKEPGEFDDEGDWYENEKYQKPPDDRLLYLHQAAIHKSVDCLIALLDWYDIEGTAVVNLQNEYKETPLHLAVLKGLIESTKVLLRKGASVDSFDYWYESPLHNAAYTDNIEIARILLEYGADPNEKNEFGLTPVHIAFVHLNFPLVKLFSEYGADFTLKPFVEINQDCHILDLLDQVSGYKEGETEQFVLELIPLLNYGYDDSDYKWGEKVENFDPEIRTAQLELVEQLLDFTSEVQISEFFPGFDYYDLGTKLEYTIDHGDVEKLDELTDFILDDPENIAAVLDAESLSHLKEELLDQWFEVATAEQYQNLKCYAEKYEDQDFLKRIKEDEALMAEDDSHYLSTEESTITASSSEALSNLVLWTAQMKISHLAPSAPQSTSNVLSDSQTVKDKRALK